VASQSVLKDDNAVRDFALDSDTVYSSTVLGKREPVTGDTTQMDARSSILLVRR